MFRGVSLTACAVAALASTPAFAGCNDFAPVSNSTVICTTAAPNPARTSILAEIGSTNVTVIVNPGAGIQTLGAAIRIQNNSTVTNNGTIQTSSNFGYGMWSGNPNDATSATIGYGNTLTNNGSIVTTGTNAVGIFARTFNATTGNTLVNNGTIDTYGTIASTGIRSSAGIRADSVAPSFIVNSGTVTAHGAATVIGANIGGNAIEITGPGTITNLATGVVNSINAYGILGGSSGITLDNSGAISGKLGAVLLGAGADTMIIRAGSVISGSIDGGGSALASASAQDELTFDGFVNPAFDNPIVNWGVLNVTGNSAVGLNASQYAFDSIRIDSGSTLHFINTTLSAPSGIENNGSLSITTAATQTLSSSISGSGTFLKDGSGTLTLIGANTYTGTTTVNAGSVQAGSPGAFASASAFTVASGAKLDLAGFSQTVASLDNGGTVVIGSAQSSSTGTALTVTGAYLSNNGNLVLNTVRGGDSVPTDEMIAGSVSIGLGPTKLFVNSIGNVSAETKANGIKVITVDGASAAGAFVLGRRVAAGAYDYTLRQGGVGNAAGNGDWYLYSAPPNDYREEVPLDMAAPALASRFGIAMLGTWHDRSGGGMSSNAAGAEGSPKMGWGRIFGETGSAGKTDAATLVNHGPRYDFNLGGLQAGSDIYQRQNADGSRDVLGLYFGTGRIVGSVKAPTGAKAGTTTMDASSIGAYWTRKGETGWYLDAVAQNSWYTSIHSDSLAGQNFKTSGYGFVASLEGGYPIALGSWRIEPQAQVIYQHLSINDNQDDFALIRYTGTDAAYIRAGLRLTRDWTLDDGRVFTTWGRANFWYDFDAGAKTTFSALDGTDPVSFKTDLGGSWV